VGQAFPVNADPLARVRAQGGVIFLQGFAKSFPIRCLFNADPALALSARRREQGEIVFHQAL
jgi:hypothetical protein